MFLTLNVEEVKQAVAEYINHTGKFKGIVIQPKHIEVKMEAEGRFEDRTEVFAGVIVNLEAATQSPKRQNA